MSKAVNYRLRHEREKRGWSQARVAEQIGSDAVTVSRWERGHAMPSPYFREKLCHLFQKNAQDLGFLPEESIQEEQQLVPPSVSTLEHSPLEGLETAHSQQEQKLQMQDQSSRIFACLSYLLGWVSGAFIFLLNKKKRFVRFHSLQAMLFFGASNLLMLMLLIVLGQIPSSQSVSNHVIHILLSLAEIGTPILLALLGLFTFIVWIVGIYQAWQGNYYQFPFVGQFVEKLIAQ